MSRLYSCVFDAVAITAVQDIFAIVAPTNATVRLHQLDLFQTSDLSDAQEEVLRIRIRQGQTVAGSGGAAGTIVPQDVDDAASGSTVRTNDTTQANTGTIVVDEIFGWNIRVPLTRIWTPECRPIVKGGRRATIELVAAPADSVTVSGGLIWQEG
jgi:hypothetical protein